jgi:enoyl-CoA hydratase/carnithine racemase
MSALLIEDRGAVRVLTMNRPEKRNALNAELRQHLLDALHSAERDDGVGAIVLTGAGPAFCAGADLAEMKAPPEPRSAERLLELNLVFSRISKPVVSAINGAAMGAGAALAIAADLAVMAEGAKLGYPETRHGIVPTLVMANLVRQVGRKAAFELVALAEPVDAARALALGMVNRVARQEEVVPLGVALAGKLASLPRPAMAQTKRLFHEVADLALEAALARGLDASNQGRTTIS